MNEEYRLFLDDVRNPPEVGNYMYPVDLRKEYRLYDWVIVRNYQEFIDYISENGLPTYVSFDHDLADEHYDVDNWFEEKELFKEKTGLDCAKWMVDYCIDNKLKLPIFYSHSMNPIGKENILNLLNNYDKSSMDRTEKTS